MAINTDEEFESFLDEEIAWRRIELSTMASQLESTARSRSDSPLARGLARGLSTLLYAHWEGFGKAALETYLRLVLKRRPKVHELGDGLLTAHVRSLVQRLESGDDGARYDVLALARGESKQRARFNHLKIIDTRSNLRYEIFNDLLVTLDLPNHTFETRQVMIDTLLCDRRNAIAHGRSSFPDYRSVLELKDQVVDMMEQLRTILIDCVRTKNYQKGRSVDTSSALMNA